MTKQGRAPLLILVAIWSLFLLVLWFDVLPAGPVRAMAWACLVIVSIRVLVTGLPRRGRRPLSRPRSDSMAAEGTGRGRAPR